MGEYEIACKELEQFWVKYRQAQDVIIKYQLLNKDSNILFDVNTIRERYEKVKKHVSSSPLSKRISDVLNACDTIESAPIKEAELIEKRNEWFLENGFTKENIEKYVNEQDREIIKYVGKPLAHYEQDTFALEFYKKHGARTHKQKIRALQKELGRGDVHARGNWREPKWKQRQFKCRALEHILLLDKGIKA